MVLNLNMHLFTCIEIWAALGVNDYVLSKDVGFRLFKTITGQCHLILKVPH
jgi:hypothetical protein